MVILGFQMQISIKMWQNIQKLVDGPSSYYTVSPQIGYGWGSKHSNTAMSSNMILDTLQKYSKTEAMVISWF